MVTGVPERFFDPVDGCLMVNPVGHGFRGEDYGHVFDFYSEKIRGILREYIAKSIRCPVDGCSQRISLKSRVVTENGRLLVGHGFRDGSGRHEFELYSKEIQAAKRKIRSIRCPVDGCSQKILLKSGSQLAKEIEKFVDRNFGENSFFEMQKLNAKSRRLFVEEWKRLVEKKRDFCDVRDFTGGKFFDESFKSNYEKLGFKTKLGCSKL
jgi:hypothetical protein